MYHDLDTEMLYREYKYDYGLDKLIRLSAVSRLYDGIKYIS